MKQILKKIMAGLLALLTVTGTVLSGSTTVMAASPSANIAFWNASVSRSGEVSELKAGYDHGKVLYAILDGNAAYCVNFGLDAKNGILMNSYDNPSTSLSAAQQKLLSYCLYYGFNSNSASSPSSDQCDQYIATQTMVWVIVANIFGTDSDISAAIKLCNTAPNPNTSFAYYLDLKNKISASYYASYPSFASRTTGGAPTYELKWNDGSGRFEMTLNDTNGVLSGYSFSISGYDISQNGNSITISTANPNTTGTLGTFTSISGAVDTTSSCVFWLTGRAGFQEFISERPTADLLRAYINVKTENTGWAQMVKTDEESGVKLAGAVYGLYRDSSCTNLATTMTTDANGYAKSGGVEAGTYYVREITAPKGYVWSNRVQTISVLAGRTTSIEATDKEQMGAITISKQGEVLTGWDGENFTYMTRKLPGAAFTVTAGADIYKVDGTKVYSEGDVIAENLVTGSDGEVVLNNLRLGTYVVTETKSIEGYTINTEPQTVNITYKDQMVEVQYEATTITNTRQKANVVVEKVESDTGNPLLEAEFTLYAANDIANYDGEVIVEKDTALETVTTDEEGSAAYTIDLPIQNSYYIAETKAPYGYYRNQDDTYTFDFTYLPETEEEITFSHTFMNDRTTAKIEIHKLDKETQTAVPQGVGKLSGAVYGVYAKENIIHPDGLTGVIFNAGDLVAKITTETDGVGYADDLYLGSYIIKELEPSDGYLIDEEEYEITCEYEDDLVAEVVGSVTSYEQVIKAEFSKVDSAGNKIAGAKLSVLDANGNVVESWTTEVDKPHTIAGIPASGYALREESAPYGYKVASDVIFTIARTPEIQKISMTDEKITGKIIIEKTNEKNKKPIAGVEFEIRDANGALIETLVTDEKGEACSKELAICTYNSDGSYKEDIKYYVVETKAAAGYILDSTKHEIVLRQTAETKDIVTYTLSVTNRPTRLKLPQTGGNYNPWLLGGIGFGIAALGFALATKKKKMEELEHDEL